MTQQTEEQRAELGIRRDDRGWLTIQELSGVTTRYPLLPIPTLRKPIRAVLLDLDGTSIQSESFWAGMVAETLERSGGRRLESADRSLLRGGSVDEHLQQLIARYHLQLTLPEMVAVYNQVVDDRFFRPSIDVVASKMPLSLGFARLRDHLKEAGIPLLLVTNGDSGKAARELEVIAHHLGVGNLGDVCGGIWCSPRRSGGYLNAFGGRAGKPHPWPYLEAAASGAGVATKDMASVVGVDDSLAGIVSLRLAGAIPFGLKSEHFSRLGGEEFAIRVLDTLEDLLEIAT